MPKLTRRSMLALAGATPLAACGSSKPDSQTSGNVQSSAVFAHGLASGDPAKTGVVLWTRVTPEFEDSPQVNLDWSVEDEGGRTVASGTVITTIARDYTVKVWADGLQPGKSYSYSFIARGETISGKTKTLPEGAIDNARFAIVSCANYQAGFFNVYHHIARQDVDAVIHLGDYFYEYGREGWGGQRGESLGRLHEPPHEIVSLSDYRTRHAQYRSDPDLQAMTAAHPLISIWDDHESANDSWEGGAENHQSDTEGDWSERKLAALKAYYEWMPIREPESGGYLNRPLRSFSFGDLLTLAVAETRLDARAEPILIDEYTKEMNGADDAARFTQDVLYAPDRLMMSEALEDQIVSALKASKDAEQSWRLLANQVILGRLLTPDLTPHVDEASVQALEKDWPGVRDFVRNSAFALPVYPDSWDGYPWAREKFYSALDRVGINDLLCLTGDAHEFWLNELTTDDGVKIGMEVVTTSVTSPTLLEYFGTATEDYALLMTQSNADVRYYNAMHNGYIDLNLKKTRASVKMMTVSSVTHRNYSAMTTAQFTLRKRGDGTVKASRPKGLNLKQRALYHGLG